MARQRREEVLPQQPAAADLTAAAGRRRQGALVLRTGTSAAQAVTWARRLRGPVLDRSASPRLDDLHRLCLSATPAPEGGGSGEKKVVPNGPPPQPSLPEIRRAIIARLFAPPAIPYRCPHCHRRILQHASK